MHTTATRAVAVLALAVFAAVAAAAPPAFFPCQRGLRIIVTERTYLCLQAPGDIEAVPDGDDLFSAHVQNDGSRGWSGFTTQDVIAGYTIANRDAGRNVWVRTWGQHFGRPAAFAKHFYVADANMDGTVNSHDISAFLAAWHTSIDNRMLGIHDPRGDFDCNGSVNSADISAFNAAWLECVMHQQAAQQPQPVQPEESPLG